MAEADNHHVQPDQPFNANNEMFRVRRLILESIEVAIHVINGFLPVCGPNKLIDILKQILPTAFFLNTSYWPFYETENGHSLCICEIFGCPCTHTNRCVSWINLDTDIQENCVFKTSKAVSITPVDLEMNIIYPKTDNIVNFKTFKVVLRYKIKQYNKEPLSTEYILPTTYYSVLRCCMRKMTKKIENFCVWFNPHPTANPLYGQYLDLLRIYHKPTPAPNCLVVDGKECLNYTAYISSSCSGTIEGPVEEFNKRDNEHDEESAAEKRNNDESDVPTPYNELNFLNYRQ